MTDLLNDWGNGDATKVAMDRDALMDKTLEAIQQLRTALEQQDPGMGNFLNMINVQLRQFPELVHLLPDDEIATVVQAHCMKKFEYLDKKSKPKEKKSKSSAALPEGGVVADLL